VFLGLDFDKMNEIKGLSLFKRVTEVLVVAINFGLNGHKFREFMAI